MERTEDHQKFNLFGDASADWSWNENVYGSRDGGWSRILAENRLAPANDWSINTTPKMVWVKNRYWKMETYHPTFLGFESTSKTLRKTKEEMISSVRRIALPFAVQMHIDTKREKINFAFKYSTAKILYIELKAYTDQCVIAHYENSFEVC